MSSASSTSSPSRKRRRNGIHSGTGRDDAAPGGPDDEEPREGRLPEAALDPDAAPGPAQPDRRQGVHGAAGAVLLARAAAEPRRGHPADEARGGGQPWRRDDRQERRLGRRQRRRPV